MALPGAVVIGRLRMRVYGSRGEGKEVMLLLVLVVLVVGVAVAMDGSHGGDRGSGRRVGRVES
jgi:hypothetical protein